MHKSIENIFENFERWVNEKNARIHPVLDQFKGYLAPDEVHGVYRPLQEDLPDKHIPYVIQQVEGEVRQFVADILVKLDKFDNALEIGLGEFGGSHILWSMIFKDVYTVELHKDAMHRFIVNNSLDTHSHLICADSFNKQTLKEIPDGLDFLFIDGDHSYNGVKTDYLTYKDKVRAGGIIGFHDAASEKLDIKRFLSYLEAGLIDGQKHEVTKIIASKEAGIAYIQI